MKQISLKIPFVAILTLFFGCASSYKAINPEYINYPTSNVVDRLTFSYKYDVLWESGNRKYAKHEKKNNVKLVAVKIINNTGQKINLARDVSFHTSSKQFIPEEPKVVKHELKQGVVIYLLYLLLTPTNLYETHPTYYYSEGTTTTIFPVGLVLGPVMSGGNMLDAGLANSKFYKDLLNHNINQDVEDGQTAYCLLGFRGIEYEPLTIKFKSQ